MRMNDKSAERRILVLGSGGHSRAVTSYAWDALPEDLNVADYDTVVVDLTSLDNEELDEHATKDRMPTASSVASQICSEEAEFLLVGAPDRFFDYRGVNATLKRWFPFLPKPRRASGETVDLEDESFAFYFKNVDRWSFHWGWTAESNRDSVQRYAQSVGRNLYTLEPDISGIARTRFGRGVAFRMDIRLLVAVPQRRGLELIDAGLGGCVIWLPPPTRVTVPEAIDEILRHRYGLVGTRRRPDWIAGYELPNQTEAAELLGEAEERLHAARQAASDAQAALEAEGRYLDLLYEQGQEGLEPVVKDALRRLGATVDEPKIKGAEDCRLHDPKGRGAVCEIKGRRGAVRLSDVRQLQQWVDDALANEGTQVEGILWGNGHIDLPPSERPECFAPNGVDFARVKGLRLVSTFTVFEALRRVQAGDLDPADFWDAVFSASPLFEPPWE